MALSRSLRTNAAYAAAHYGKSLFWYMTELLFAFYLAEVYGVAPATIGVLLFAFLLWDAATDPIIGLAIARRRISTRGLLRMQVIGAGLSAATFLLVFHKPDLSQSHLAAYALMMGMLFRTAYTVYDVPQNTLMSRLAPTDQGRLTLSTVRAAFSAVAKLTISFVTVVILADDEQSARAAGFAAAALIFAGAAIGSAFLLDRAGAQSESGVDGPREAAELSVVLRATFLSPPFVSLFVAISLLSVGWPLFTKLIPFFAAYVRGGADNAGVYGAAMAVAAIASHPLWLMLGSRVSRGRFIAAALAAFVLASTLFVLTAQRSEVLVIAAIGLMAASSSALSLVMWARLADRLNEAQFSHVNDVLAFGLFTFASKAALSIGGLLLGATLQIVGYERGAAMAPDQQADLVRIMAAAPAAAGVLAVLLELGIRRAVGLAPQSAR